MFPLCHQSCEWLAAKLINWLAGWLASWLAAVQSDGDCVTDLLSFLKNEHLTLLLTSYQ